MKNVGRHASEKRGHFNPVIHVHTRRAAANGIDPRQVRGSFLEGIHDAIIMVLRIGLGTWVPNRFLAKNDSAVNNGGHFAVATPQIKADTAAIKVPSKLPGLSVFAGDIASVHELERVIEHALAYHL